VLTFQNNWPKQLAKTTGQNNWPKQLANAPGALRSASARQESQGRVRYQQPVRYQHNDTGMTSGAAQDHNGGFRAR
jgi:hypothetical protein